MGVGAYAYYGYMPTPTTCRTCGKTSEEVKFYPSYPYRCSLCLAEARRQRGLRGTYSGRTKFGVGQERQCDVCGTVFCASDSRVKRCSSECNRIANNRDQVARTRKYNYGVSQEDYDRLLELQGGVCAICGGAERVDGRSFSVDHDHTCCPQGSSCGRCIRGLLCHSCNAGLGYFRDNPGNLAAAIKYLGG